VGHADRLEAVAPDYRFDGRQKKLALGSYPALGLKDAHTARDRAKETIAAGRDPGEARKVEKAA